MLAFSKCFWPMLLAGCRIGGLDASNPILLRCLSVGRGYGYGSPGDRYVWAVAGHRPDLRGFRTRN